MQMSAMSGAKTSAFFEIYGLSARTRGRGLSRCGQGRREGQFFADVFYGRSLTCLFYLPTRFVRHKFAM